VLKEPIVHSLHEDQIMDTNKIEKLKRDIEELERQIDANPFGGLFDKQRMERLRKKLKKRRKELATLEKAKKPS
jgi:hypothetical protein